METFCLPSVEEFKENQEKGLHLNWNHQFGRALQIISKQLEDIAVVLSNIAEGQKTREL